jgi:hypothetical protein
MEPTHVKLDLFHCQVTETVLYGLRQNAANLDTTAFPCTSAELLDNIGAAVAGVMITITTIRLLDRDLMPAYLVRISWILNPGSGGETKWQLATLYEKVGKDCLQSRGKPAHMCLVPAAHTLSSSFGPLRGALRAN